MTNPAGPEPELGVDERGLPAATLVFLVVNLLATLVWFAMLLKQPTGFPVLRLLSCAFVLELVASFTVSLHFQEYVHDGVGVPALLTVGQVLHTLSDVSLLSLLLLFSRGWLVSTFTLKHTRLLLASVISLAVLATAALITHTLTRDPASNLYLYSSGIGYSMIAVLIALLLFFWLSLATTYNSEQAAHKRAFYKQLFGLGSFWFLSLPVVVLLAAVLDPWVRMLVVSCVQMSARSLL